MRYRDKDWMVTRAGWDETGWSMTVGTLYAIPLTLSTAAGIGTGLATTESSAGVFQSNDNWTLERVRGSIDLRWEWTTDVFQTIALDCRLEVFDADDTGAPAILSNYTLKHADYANRAFLWHHGEYHRTYTQFWADSWQGTPGKTRIEVDCRARRRIETGQAVFLMMSFDAHGGPTPPGTMDAMLRLRTLGSKQT